MSHNFTPTLPDVTLEKCLLMLDHRHPHAVCHNKMMKKKLRPVADLQHVPQAQDASMLGETAFKMHGMHEHLTASCWRVSTAS